MAAPAWGGNPEKDTASPKGGAALRRSAAIAELVTA